MKLSSFAYLALPWHWLRLSKDDEHFHGMAQFLSCEGLCAWYLLFSSASSANQNVHWKEMYLYLFILEWKKKCINWRQMKTNRQIS